MGSGDLPSHPPPNPGHWRSPLTPDIHIGDTVTVRRLGYVILAESLAGLTGRVVAIRKPKQSERLYAVRFHSGKRAPLWFHASDLELVAPA